MILTAVCSRKGYELNMLDEFMKKPLPEIPEEIGRAIREKRVSATAFSNKNSILEDVNLHKETGFCTLGDSSRLVSMVCPMPNVTPEMIEWWFWWHPQDKKRYMVWFPTEHYDIGYAKKDESYFSCASLPQFRENTQYPTERIGKMKAQLAIRFVSPQDFGFDTQLMKKNGIPLIVCGHVGVLKGAVMHTEMAHIFKQEGNGLVLISRFWMGSGLKSKMLRKLIFNDEAAVGMAEHCCVEYRNLAEILPLLYERFH